MRQVVITGKEKEVLRLRGQNFTEREIAERTGLNKTKVHDICVRAGAKPALKNRKGADRVSAKKASAKRPAAKRAAVEVIPATVQETVAFDRDKKKLLEEASSYKRKYEYLLKEYEDSEARLGVVLDIRDRVQPIKIEVDRSINGGQATALWLASDWHVGERVDPKTVNGLNKYTPEIATKRAANYFQNGMKLVRKERHEIEINTLILWLGGDLITGYIHEEGMEDNYLSPTQEMVLAYNLIAGGINMLLEDGEFDRIIVPCNYGNHGRTTQKRRHSTAAANSYEWLLYQHLAEHFKDVAEIEFQVASGYINYVDVYDKVLRFHHGDNVSYQGGIGGVTIPLNKFIDKTNKQRRADLDAIGHFHQLDPYAYWRRFIVNGSLIGFNAYAQSIGASPERPQQAFQLIDAKRGFTAAFPIVVGENDGSDPRSASYSGQKK